MRRRFRSIGIPACGEDARGECCSWFTGDKPVDTNQNRVIGYARVPQYGGG
eukprot:gene8469-5004_t